MGKKLLATILSLGTIGYGAYTYLKSRSKPVADHPFLDLPKPLVMAHRGGQGLWPPNTLYAFRRAVELGVDVLEMDIHLTKDGVIVVRHDPTVDATTDGKGAIAEMTLEEIQALDAGYTWTSDGGKTFPFRGRGFTIPTLEEVLAAFKDTRFNIDIKPQDPAIVPIFAEMLREHDRLDTVLVASFHDTQLAKFRELCPQVATAAGVRETSVLFGLNTIHLEAAYQPRAEAFQPPEFQGDLHIVTPSFIQAAHIHNMEVHPWTINEVEDMQRLLDWEVDGLITDYPNRLMKLLGRLPE